jgi:cyclase
MTTSDGAGTFQRFDPRQQPAAVPVTITPLRGSVYILEGSGGNAVASAGPDGIFLVDDFYEVMWDELQTALARLSSAPVRFVAITHWHPDHIGNNENLARTGTLVLGADRMRERSAQAHYIKEVDLEMPAGRELARPAMTYSDAATYYLNDEQIEVLASPPAHTDTDSIVVFRRANVIAAGDLYYDGVYPLLDTLSGGSINTAITEVRRIADLADDETVIVAGHGPFGPDRPRAGKQSLTGYLTVLTTIRDRVQAAIKDGRDLDKVLAAKPSADFDAAWGYGMVAPDTFVTSVYYSLVASRR